MKTTCALILTLLSICGAVAAQDFPPESDAMARIDAATVLILSGEGAGRVSSVSTGVVVRPDGVILTAYHAVKNAREVQVRLHTGEVYDNVILLGFDERRDVAALKIIAGSLPVLPTGMGAEAKPGEAVYIVSSSGGLAWSASEGIISAVRLADDVPGAGHGYRLLQITAPVSGGASGGPLANARGTLLGIITKGLANGTGYAVPVEAVIGLADGTGKRVLGSGAALRMPTTREPSPSPAAGVSSTAHDLLRAAKTVLIESRTMYFTPASLEKALAGEKGFDALGLALVEDLRAADLLISVDRPLFTYTFTYSVTDPKTSMVLDSGKVIAIDGSTAAAKIAKQLVGKWTKLRVAEPAENPM